MDNTTSELKQQEHQRRVIVIGEDDKGNEIQYIDNEDGTWTNLYSEHVFEDAFMLAHFSQFFAIPVDVKQLQRVTA